MKATRNRLVIGQGIVGLDIFELNYDGYRSVEAVILCGRSDPALERICIEIV
jgi:hypothetical protein